MAQEAKIRVRLEVDEAKKDLDQVNRGFEKTKQTASDFIALARSAVTRGVAIAAAGAGVIDRAVGGGFFGALGSTIGSFTGAAARRLAPTGALQEGVAQSNALDRAIATTRELVSAGGNVSDEQIRSLISDFQKLYAPGARNEQRVEVQGQEIRVSTQLANASKNLENAAESLRKAVAPGGR